MVRRRMRHHHQGSLRKMGKQRLTAPLATEFLGHWTVRISRFPCTFQHPWGGGYPAVLRHRMHHHEPLALPWWCLHPRPIFLPVPEKLMAMGFRHIGLIHIPCRTNLAKTSLPPVRNFPTVIPSPLNFYAK